MVKYAYLAGMRVLCSNRGFYGRIYAAVVVWKNDGAPMHEQSTTYLMVGVSGHDYIKRLAFHLAGQPDCAKPGAQLMLSSSGALQRSRAAITAPAQSGGSLWLFPILISTEVCSRMRFYATPVR